MNIDDNFKPTHTPISLDKYEKKFEFNRNKILNSLLLNGKSKSALDIGCGPGYFTKTLTDNGWIVSAIDTDINNIKQTKKYTDTAFHGDAISVLLDQDKESYDFALCLELIEHMPIDQGQKLLHEIFRVLRPGSNLVLSTPNRFSLEGLIGYYFEEKLRGTSKWNAWDLTHCYIYSSNEIIKQLKKTGFSIDKVIGYYYDSRFPVIGSIKLPIVSSTIFPLNRLGFNIIIKCSKSFVCNDKQQRSS